MSKFYYIAYGSNINLEQMAMRCPNSETAGTAMLNGYELQFRYHATIEQKDGCETPVLLWKLDRQDERRLDVYEGYPKYYRKECLPIELNGEKVNAMVYIMNGDRPITAPSKEYYRIIENGYLENGLDTSYLETALNESIQADELRQDEEMQIKNIFS